MIGTRVFYEIIWADLSGASVLEDKGLLGKIGLTLLTGVVLQNVVESVAEASKRWFFSFYFEGCIKLLGPLATTLIYIKTKVDVD